MENGLLCNEIRVIPTRNHNRLREMCRIGDTIQRLLEQGTLPNEFEDRLGPVRPTKWPQPRSITATQDNRLYHLRSVPMIGVTGEIAVQRRAVS